MLPCLTLQSIRPEIAAVAIDSVNAKVNVLSTGMWRELQGILNQLTTRTDLKGLILHSTKPGVFIAGADLKELADATPDNPKPTRSYLELGHSVLNQLESLPFPTLAAVDGFCLGGGLEVALACDFRLAGTSPKFQMGFPEVFLGLIPGWGGTQRMARLRGPFEALRHICSGINLNAEQAVAESLAIESVSSELVLQRGCEILLREFPESNWREIRNIKREPMRREFISSLGPDAEKLLLQQMLQYMEQLQGPARAPSLEAVNVIFQGGKLPLEKGLRAETEAFLRLAGTPESKRMIEDFFNRKRK